jgi:hypothetical protein
MFLTYARLCGSPGTFRALIGVSVERFDALLGAIEPLDASARAARPARAGGERAPGGGRPGKLAPAEQLLMALTWVHLHPNHEALAGLFGVSDSTVSRYLARLLPALMPLLEHSDWATTAMEDPGRKQRLTLEQLLGGIPKLREYLRP